MRSIVSLLVSLSLCGCVTTSSNIAAPITKYLTQAQQNSVAVDADITSARTHVQAIERDTKEILNLIQ